MPDPEDVLGVDRGVVRRAAGGDDDVLDLLAPVAERVGQGIDGAGLRLEEARRDRGLFEDLVVEAHERATATPSTRTGSRPANGIAPDSASASATIEAVWIE